jgi:hypothetical protein
MFPNKEQDKELTERLRMTNDYLECPELTGKTIKNLKLYKDSPERCEVLIEFTDGTSFSCALDIQSTIKASLIRTGIGTPDILREYLT